MSMNNFVDTWDESHQGSKDRIFIHSWTDSTEAFSFPIPQWGSHEVDGRVRECGAVVLENSVRDWHVEGRVWMDVWSAAAEWATRLARCIHWPGSFSWFFGWPRPWPFEYPDEWTRLSRCASFYFSLSLSLSCSDSLGGEVCRRGGLNL